MNIAIPKCPTCDQLAEGTIETVTGCARLDINPDGSAEYGGYTDVYWDSQKTVLDNDGKATLVCCNGHEWQSKIEDL